MDKPKPPFRVVIEIPDPLPITDDELALIEAHLAAIIVQMVEAEVPDPEMA